MKDKRADGVNVNPFWILRSAKMDKVSADELYEKSIQFMCSEDEAENFTSISNSNGAIILYALCIEHGLKSLLRFVGEERVSGHDIKALFQSLPNDLQREIKGKLSEDRFRISFDSYLEENKNDFIEWRYSYEKTVAASSDFLKAFSEAIIKVGESL